MVVEMEEVVLEVATEAEETGAAMAAEMAVARVEVARVEVATVEGLEGERGEEE